MPRDLDYQPTTPLQLTLPHVTLKPDLNKPSLAALAYLLRHPDERKPAAQPDQFLWDFTVGLANRFDDTWGICGTRGCAYGIATLQWGAAISTLGEVEKAASKFFGISVNAAWAIFMAGASHLDNYDEDETDTERKARYCPVTEEEVAQRIDHYLAHHTEGRLCRRTQAKP